AVLPPTSWWVCRLGWCLFFFSSRRRHTSFDCDWSSDVCSSDLRVPQKRPRPPMTPAARSIFVFGVYLALLGAGLMLVPNLLLARSEERRVGKEDSRRCAADHPHKQPEAERPAHPAHLASHAPTV